MGSGKTTIGTLLARQLAWRFVDLDDRIEASAGLPIPQIFERLGEPAFRQIEADQLRAALGRAAEMKESTVLALGGGTYAQPGCPGFVAGFAHRSSACAMHDHDRSAAFPRRIQLQRALRPASPFLSTCRLPRGQFRRTNSGCRGNSAPRYCCIWWKRRASGG